ncbi:hypothetical protein C7N43_19845 [Sphingobacteriales bacterium UPWRP_1]|nr:hypothetical protein BVG80_02565 [Sphingobacteriales bacterium TSM_CSM]PSJ75240.1 hypothetical protein C7N43_19845 [Sphingobacteriales bacterium UPWRP_1]
MRNSSYILIIAMLFLSFTACNKGTDKIAGSWERFDDESSGTVVKVEKVGDAFEGKITHASGNLAELGFEEGDVKWKEIAPDTNEKKRYSGKDLVKAIDNNNQVAKTEYVDIYFEFLSNDIMQVLDSSGAQGGTSRPQKWRRIN